MIKTKRKEESNDLQFQTKFELCKKILSLKDQKNLKDAEFKELSGLTTTQVKDLVELQFDSISQSSLLEVVKKLQN